MKGFINMKCKLNFIIFLTILHIFAQKYIKPEITENKTPDSYQTEFIVKLKKKQPLKYLELAETIAEGQKVEAFKIHSKTDDGFWNFEEHGTTIGSRKIVVLENVETNELKVQITSARDVVKLDWVRVY